MYNQLETFEHKMFLIVINYVALIQYIEKFEKKKVKVFSVNFLLLFT